MKTVLKDRRRQADGEGGRWAWDTVSMISITREIADPLVPPLS